MLLPHLTNEENKVQRGKINSHNHTTRKRSIQATDHKVKYTGATLHVEVSAVLILLTCLQHLLRTEHHERDRSLQTHIPSGPCLQSSLGSSQGVRETEASGSIYSLRWPAGFPEACPLEGVTGLVPMNAQRHKQTSRMHSAA